MQNANTNTPKKQVNQITWMQLFQLLIAVVGHPFTAVTLFTEPTLKGGKKTLALFNGAVYKYARYVFVNNRKYDRAVELLAEKLGLNFENWKPQAHLYADHFQGNVLFHRADANMPIEMRRLYAQFMLHSGCTIEYQYFDANMREIDYNTIKPYLQDKTSKKQADFGIAKSEQIPVINPSLKSIKSVSMNGQIYEVVEA